MRYRESNIWPKHGLTILTALCVCVVACNAKHEARYEAEYLFLDHLSTSKTNNASSLPPQYQSIELRYDRRPSLTFQPPAEILFSDVPTDHNARFETALATIRSEESNLQLASLQFEALCKNEQGSWVNLFKTTIPSSVSGSSEQTWHEHMARLDHCSQPITQITLRNAGLADAGCGSAEAVWANPRVIRTRVFAPDLPRLSILISVDTLRPDHLSIYDSHRQSSPCLERFANDAIVYETALSSAPWTIPSHATLFTSTFPLVHGTTRQSAIPDSLPSLAQTLSRAGWQTAGFVDSGFLSERFGFHHGFDYYDDDPPAKGLRIKGVRAVMQRVFNWLDLAPSKPTFVFWHIMDVHGPYGASAPFAGRFRSAVRPSPGDDYCLERLRQLAYHDYLDLDRFTSFSELVAAYDEGILVVDDALGEFFQLLRAANLYDDALIVVTSDHGESFFDHSVWVGHGLFLTDDELRVPLIIKLPGTKLANSRIKEMVGLIDVAPTILDVLRVPPPAPFQGRSIISPAPGTHHPEVLYGYSSNTGAAFVRTERLKYIEPADRTKVFKALRPHDNHQPIPETWEYEQLYDIEHDPLEVNQLANTRESELESLRALVEYHRTRSADIGNRMRNASVKPSLPGEDQMRLLALGYVTEETEHIFSFLQHFGEAEIAAPSKNHVKVSRLSVAGEPRQVLYQHPDSEVSFKGLSVPFDTTLCFGIGISEKVWNRKGDGVLFEIVIKTEQAERTVYSKYIDPKNIVGDRQWFDHSIDLGELTNNPVTVVFRTTSGPTDNHVCDWAGWSEPRLVTRTSPPKR